MAATKFQPMRARISAGCVAGIAWLLPQAPTAMSDDQPGDQLRTVLAGDQHPGDGAEEDREKRPGLDQRIAEQQIVEAEQVGQDRVFERPEKRRLDAHHEQQRQHQPGALEQHRRRGDQHHRDLGGLDDADEPRLVERVGQLARRRRAQEERQDEEAAGQRDQDAGGHAPRHLRPVGQHQHQRVLQRVVVEGREELRREQRPEPPRADQRQRAGARRLSCGVHTPISHTPRCMGNARPSRQPLRGFPTQDEED